MQMLCPISQIENDGSMSVSRRCLKCVRGACYRVKRQVPFPRNSAGAFIISVTAAFAFSVRARFRPPCSWPVVSRHQTFQFLFRH
jgi:hypothetical protein